jgi:hypothetical protein
VPPATHASSARSAPGEVPYAAITGTMPRQAASRTNVPGTQACTALYVSTQPASSSDHHSVAPELTASIAVPTASIDSPANCARAAEMRPEGIGRRGRSRASIRASKASFSTMPAT